MTHMYTPAHNRHVFDPIMSFAIQIQLQVAPPPHLVTGGEDLSYPGPVEAGVIVDGFLCPTVASIQVFILRVR